MNETVETEATNEPLTGTLSDLYEAPTTEQPESDEQTTTEQSTTKQPAADAQPQITPEQITESVRAGLREAQPQPPAKQWTQQEIDAAFNVWQPTQEVVDQLLAGGEGAVKAMLTMREGMSKQFGTLLQYQLEVLKQEILGQVSPALTFAQEQTAAKDREAFFEFAPDLKPFEALTQTVFNALKAEGYKAKTTEEAYKTLADRTRALLPSGGNGSGATPTGGARTTTPTHKRPASLSSGSQAGGGGSSAPAAPFPGAEIWSD